MRLSGTCESTSQRVGFGPMTGRNKWGHRLPSVLSIGGRTSHHHRQSHPSLSSPLASFAPPFPYLNLRYSPLCSMIRPFSSHLCHLISLLRSELHPILPLGLRSWSDHSLFLAGSWISGLMASISVPCPKCSVIPRNWATKSSPLPSFSNPPPSSVSGSAWLPSSKVTLWNLGLCGYYQRETLPIVGLVSSVICLVVSIF